MFWTGFKLKCQLLFVLLVLWLPLMYQQCRISCAFVLNVISAVKCSVLWFYVEIVWKMQRNAYHSITLSPFQIIICFTFWTQVWPSIQNNLFDFFYRVWLLPCAWVLDLFCTPILATRTPQSLQARILRWVDLWETFDPIWFKVQKLLHVLDRLCSVNWWLVLIWCDRKVLIWCDRKVRQIEAPTLSGC